MGRRESTERRPTALAPAERTWAIARRMAKNGAMTIQEVAHYLHCSERTAKHTLRTMQHFTPPVPIYRRTEPGENKNFRYVMDIDQLWSQFEPEAQSGK